MIPQMFQTTLLLGQIKPVPPCFFSALRRLGWRQTIELVNLLEHFGGWYWDAIRFVDGVFVPRFSPPFSQGPQSSLGTSCKLELAEDASCPRKRKDNANEIE